MKTRPLFTTLALGAACVLALTAAVYPRRTAVGGGSTFVTAASNQGLDAPVTLTLTGSYGSGNVVVVAITGFDAAVTAVTDNATSPNNYGASAALKIAHSSQASFTTEIWTTTVTDTSATTITVTLTSGTGYWGVAYAEFSGTGASVADSDTNEGSGNSPTSAALSPAGSDLVYVAVVGQSDVDNDIGNGWTQAAEETNTTDAMPIDLQYMIGTGSQTATWTFSNPGSSPFWLTSAIVFD